jgi:PKD repeat protein
MKLSHVLVNASLLLIACQHHAEDQPIPKPVAGFVAPAAVGINNTFSVQNTSTDADAYVWNWGDGNSSVGSAPSHAFSTASTFRIRLQVTGPGGVDTISKVIQVNPNSPVAPKPVAGFVAPAAVGINSSFSVQNTSTDADAYVWNWGDGSSSAGPAPSHAFSTINTFRIRLQVTGPGGMDTISKVIRVNPNRPGAAFSIPGIADTNTPVQAQNHTTDATSYRWTWGDGTAASTDVSPSHSWARLGYYRVLLQATGPGGIDTLSKVVYVNRLGPPALAPIAGNYYGHWYYESSGAGPGTSHSDGYGTEQMSIVSNNSLAFSGQTLVYAPAATSWLGHAPQRNHYDFTASQLFTTITLQIEQAGDSIYYTNRFLAAGGSLYYRFYGKKVP